MLNAHIFFIKNCSWHELFAFTYVVLERYVNIIRSSMWLLYKYGIATVIASGTSTLISRTYIYIRYAKNICSSSLCMLIAYMYGTKIG